MKIKCINEYEYIRYWDVYEVEYWWSNIVIYVFLNNRCCIFVCYNNFFL